MDCFGDIWAWYSEKIWYDEDSFVVRNFWMVKKKYSYTDITGYYTSDVFYFIMEKKKIPVNTLIEGGWEFMETARRKYAEANNGESIPEASKLPGDIFNGHITGANDIIFVAVLLVAFGVGTLIYVHIPPSGMTSEHFEGTARGVQADGEKLTFYVKGEEAPFIIKDFREYGQSMDMIWDIPAKFTKVFVDAEYVASSNGNPGYYCVYNMSDENGNVYVTFDKAWELEKERRKGGDIIIGIILIVLVICGTVCVVAGRNPRKYRRLVRLCFKKENIRY